MNETTRSPMTLEELRKCRTEILEVAEKHGAYNVRVFGSVADAIESFPTSNERITEYPKFGKNLGYKRSSEPDWDN